MIMTGSSDAINQLTQLKVWPQALIDFLLHNFR